MAGTQYTDLIASIHVMLIYYMPMPSISITNTKLTLLSQVSAATCASGWLRIVASG